MVRSGRSSNQNVYIFLCADLRMHVVCPVTVKELKSYEKQGLRVVGLPNSSPGITLSSKNDK